MSLSYETAVKLRDAGFPQNHDYSYSQETDFCFKCDRGVCFPTLSELIEECGDKIGWLGRTINGEWRADSSDDEICKYGYSSPEEAVANLWLVLNKK